MAFKPILILLSLALACVQACENGICSNSGQGCDECLRCIDGWAGKKCDIQVTCSTEGGVCEAGTCSGTEGKSTCTSCKLGYIGENCDEKVKCKLDNGLCAAEFCYGLSGTGECTSCNEGYQGNFCQCPVGESSCHPIGSTSNSECTTTSFCECLPGFYGDLCDNVLPIDVAPKEQPPTADELVWISSTEFDSSCRQLDDAGYCECRQVNALGREQGAGTCFGSYFPFDDDSLNLPDVPSSRLAFQLACSNRFLVRGEYDRAWRMLTNLGLCLESSVVSQVSNDMLQKQNFANQMFENLNTWFYPKRQVWQDILPILPLNNEEVVLNSASGIASAVALLASIAHAGIGGVISSGVNTPMNLQAGNNHGILAFLEVHDKGYAYCAMVPCPCDQKRNLETGECEPVTDVLVRMEIAMAYARCANLKPQARAKLTWIDAHAFLSRSLYCLRTLEGTEADRQQQTIAGAMEVGFRAYRALEEEITNPTGMVAQTPLILVLEAANSYVKEVSLQPLSSNSVPPYPIEFYQEKLDTLSRRLDRVQGWLQGNGFVNEVKKHIDQSKDQLLVAIKNVDNNLYGIASYVTNAFHKSTSLMLDEANMDIEQHNLLLDELELKFKDNVARIAAGHSKLETWQSNLESQTDNLQHSMSALYQVQYDLRTALAAQEYSEAFWDFLISTLTFTLSLSGGLSLGFAGRSLESISDRSLREKPCDQDLDRLQTTLQGDESLQSFEELFRSESTITNACDTKSVSNKPTPSGKVPEKAWYKEYYEKIKIKSLKRKCLSFAEFIGIEVLSAALGSGVALIIDSWVEDKPQIPCAEEGVNSFGYPRQICPSNTECCFRTGFCMSELEANCNDVAPTPTPTGGDSIPTPEPTKEPVRCFVRYQGHCRTRSNEKGNPIVHCPKQKSSTIATTSGTSCLEISSEECNALCIKEPKCRAYEMRFSASETKGVCELHIFNSDNRHHITHADGDKDAACWIDDCENSRRQQQDNRLLKAVGKPAKTTGTDCGLPPKPRETKVTRKAGTTTTGKGTKHFEKSSSTTAKTSRVRLSRGMALGAVGGLGAAAMTGQAFAASAVAFAQREATYARRMQEATDKMDQDTSHLTDAAERLRKTLRSIFLAINSVTQRLISMTSGVTVFTETQEHEGDADAFKYSASFWDSMYQEVMDLLQYDLALCAPPLPMHLAVANRRSLVDEGRLRGVSLRRSLKSKQELHEDVAREQGRERDALLGVQQACGKFEGALRQVSIWGKAVHQGILDLAEDMRKFSMLESKSNSFEARRTNVTESLASITEQGSQLLHDMREGQTEEDFEQEMTTYVTSITEFLQQTVTESEVVDLLVVAKRDVADFCNLYAYLHSDDQFVRETLCNLDSVAQASPGKALLQLRTRLEDIQREVKTSFYDSVHSAQSSAIDDPLDITEMVDFELLHEQSFKEPFTFTLEGPEGGAGLRSSNDTEDGSLLPTAANFRGGPWFAGYDNIEMIYFRLVFLDANGKVLSGSRGSDEVQVQVNLAGPFRKTKKGKPFMYEMKQYPDISTSYKVPESGTCESGEPFFHDTLCDGRFIPILSKDGSVADGGKLQAYPSPYASWTVQVVNGHQFLKGKAAQLVLMATYRGEANPEIRPRPPAQYRFYADIGTDGLRPLEVAAITLGIVAFSLVALVIIQRKHQSSKVEQGNGMVPGLEDKLHASESLESTNPIFSQLNE